MINAFYVTFLYLPYSPIFNYDKLAIHNSDRQQ